VAAEFLAVWTTGSVLQLADRVIAAGRWRRRLGSPRGTIDRDARMGTLMQLLGQPSAADTASVNRASQWLQVQTVGAVWAAALVSGHDRV